jgi:lysyl oxidase
VIGGRALAAASAAVVGLGLLAGSAGSAPPPRKLAPDLRPERAANLLLERGPERSRTLRFTTQMTNVGPGPVEVVPSAGVDCDGDGATGNDRAATQVVFLDHDGDGGYSRARDVASIRRDAGCLVFHLAHGHWHFAGAARYELRDDRSGELVGREKKVSFCLRDDVRPLPGVPGSPRGPHYPSGGGECGPDSTEGISVGWSDVYLFPLPDQTIDATGLADGRYCLGMELDPDDRLREANERNNSSARRLRLQDGSVTARRRPCRISPGSRSP